MAEDLYERTPRIDKNLFEDTGHFLGRPADYDDKIVFRRLALTGRIPGFFNKDAVLVDVGCGNGASMLRIANEFKHCVGIEIFEEHRATFEILKNHFKVENTEFVVRDIEDPKQVNPDEFDRLISFEVIEHLRSDANVTQYFRMLKPGAILAISVPNKWWVFETHGARLPLLPWNRVPFFSWLPRFIHERFANARIYTKGRIRKVLEEAGLEVKEIHYITAPMDVLKDGPLKRFLVRNFFKNDTTIWPWKATALFVHAEKPLKKG